MDITIPVSNETMEIGRNVQYDVFFNISIDQRVKLNDQSIITMCSILHCTAVQI
jgi:hypothetical protein